MIRSSLAYRQAICVCCNIHTLVGVCAYVYTHATWRYPVFYKLRVSVCVHVRVHARVYVCACVRASVYVCVRAHTRTHIQGLLPCLSIVIVCVLRREDKNNVLDWTRDVCLIRSAVFA